MNKRIKLSALLSALWITITIAAPASHMIQVRWVQSVPGDLWHDGGTCQVDRFSPDVSNDVLVTNYLDQEILGFGGCFGELGWDALQQLTPAERKRVLRELFDPNQGLRFSYCRLPIGANDFAREWYSYDEVPGDFKLEHFSIDHDKQGLIPYVKAALKLNPQLKLWASPWSPPVWMKTNGSYASRLSSDSVDNTGNRLQVDQMKQDARYLKAYAKYLSKYLKAYRKQGIKISMIMPQNEPYTWNVWPNCLWSQPAFGRFISDYLAPEITKNNTGVKIWAGTLNTDNLDHIEALVTNPHYRVAGAGVQWEGRNAVAKIHKNHPTLQLMCTENECGSGTFDWAAAEHTFSLMRDYIGGGAGAYTYFNMVLRDDGQSSWGWKQNALVRVDSKTHKATFTPELFLMRHLTHFVQVGAHRLITMGSDDSVLAFVNPDGSIVLLIVNNRSDERTLSVAVRKSVLKLKLSPHSFNTFVINQPK